MPNRIEISKRLLEVSDQISTINRKILDGEMVADLDEQIRKCDAMIAELKAAQQKADWPSQIGPSNGDHGRTRDN